MTIDITIVDSLPEGTWEILTGWREQVFPEEGIGIDWIDSQQHVLAMAEGQPVAHIGFGIYPLVIEEQPGACVGVGGVVVLPEFQGQHLPDRMFKAMREWRDRHHRELPLTLFCPERLTGYYQRHGFQVVRVPVYFDQSGSSVLCHMCFMTDRPLGHAERVELTTSPW